MSAQYNPQPLIGNYLSMMRNMFLTSSIGITTLTFSDNFKKYKHPVIIISFIIIIYSIIIGIKSSLGTQNYINIIRKQKNLPELYDAMLYNLEEWIILSFIYKLIIIILAVIIFLKEF